MFLFFCGLEIADGTVHVFKCTCKKFFIGINSDYLHVILVQVHVILFFNYVEGKESVTSRLLPYLC